MTRVYGLAAVLAALVLASACGGGSKCGAAGKCPDGTTADPMTCACVGGSGGGSGGGASTGGGSGGAAGGGSGGATGGGSGGGSTGGGSSSGGGSATGGGTGTGGGSGLTLPDGGTLAGGESCTAAVSLPMSGVQYASTTTGLQDDVSFTDLFGACISPDTAGAGDAVFSFSVPQNQRGVVQLYSQFDAVLELVAGPPSQCGAIQTDGGYDGIVCVNAADNEPELEVERSSYANTGSSAQTVFAIVDGYSDTDVGDFAISYAVVPILPGDLCTDPIVVSASGTMSAQSTTGFFHDYALDSDSSTCTSYPSPGIDRVYSVTVPNGMTLTATVTPTGVGVDDDDAVYIVESCTPFIETCLAGADDGDVGEVDEAMYTNSTGSAQTVFVVVDSSNANQPTEFSLQIQLQ